MWFFLGCCFLFLINKIIFIRVEYVLGKVLGLIMVFSLLLCLELNFNVFKIIFLVVGECCISCWCLIWFINMLLDSSGSCMCWSNLVKWMFCFLWLCLVYFIRLLNI